MAFNIHNYIGGKGNYYQTKHLSKKFRKDAKKQIAGINDKYTEAFAPDLVADVDRASRSESRRSQREVKTGRSSTILSMRDEMGMDAIGMPNQMNINKMEGRSVESKLKAGQKAEMAAVRKTLLDNTEAVGGNVSLKRLTNLGLATPQDKAAYEAKQKKKAEMQKLMSSGRYSQLSRIGGL
jgi:hypothetical protein